MKDQTYKDVPATPTGESFLNPPTSYVVVHIAIGLENPIDNIEALKSFFSTSIMLKIPRMSSLLVKRPNGRHYFRSTKVDINKHFIIRRLIEEETPKNKESEYEDLINDYIADLATDPPMSTDKPLWEIHVLVDARCLVLRIHHAIGDGASLLSMIREIGISPSGNPRIKGDEKEKSKVANKANFRLGKGEGLLGMLRYVWFSTVFSLNLGVKAFINKDKGTMLKAGKGKVVGNRHRSKLATASFNFDDVKFVKKLIPNATINDVMCGIIWGGLKKYIAARTSSGDGSIAMKEGQEITGVLMANVRKVAGLQELSTMEGKRFEKFWGNETGVFVLPIRYTKKDEDVLSLVRKAKSILNNKKRSAEPRVSLFFLKTAFHLFGPKVASKIMMNAAEKATFGFTNVMGPTEQMSIAGNPVIYLRVSPSSTPLGILLLLLSYKKNLDLQIMVDEDAVPDPKFLAACFKDTFQQMMDALN